MDNATLAQQLNVKEVGQVLGVSVPTVWRLSRAGRIPKPRKIGANSTRWDSRELREAVQQMAAV